MDITKTFCLYAALSGAVGVQAMENRKFVTQQDNTRVNNYQANRPGASKRLFVSQEVGRQIDHIKQLLTDAKPAQMFENCFPNTLGTTVHFSGKEDTLVYAGNIHAMWLRDSGAQVWPYVQLANKDPELKRMLAGVISRQLKCISIGPYANAFNMNSEEGEWMSDLTDMKPELHERKWEIDSLCYPICLAYHHWKTTGGVSVFSDEWLQVVVNALKTLKEQRCKDGARGPYRFQCKAKRVLDTMTNDSWDNPVKPVGLIVSAFHPSDDATTLQSLVPSNLFAVTSLRKATEILNTVNRKPTLAKECAALVGEVEKALEKYTVCNRPRYDKIYASEVDGFDNQLLMDDTSVPSLIALPCLGDVEVTDPIYQNTHKFVWSEDNPYFFKGSTGEGIGGPYTGYDTIRPMSIMMKVFTGQNDTEVETCIKMLTDTDTGTGFTHESFNKNDPKDFTRA